MQIMNMENELLFEDVAAENTSTCLKAALEAGVNLTGANFQGRLIKDVIIQNGILDNANFKGTTFINVECVGLNLEEAVFQNASFKNCKFFKCNFSQADLSDSRCKKILFSICDLTKTSFEGSAINSSEFYDVLARGTLFNFAILEHVRFINKCKVNEAEDALLEMSPDLPQVVVEEIVCHQSMDYLGTGFEEARLSGVYFRFVELVGVVFNHARVNQTTFYDSHINNGYITGSEFKDTDFLKTHFECVDMSESDIISSNFYDCKIQACDISSLKCSDTRFEKGEIVDPETDTKTEIKFTVRDTRLVSGDNTIFVTNSEINLREEFDRLGSTNTSADQMEESDEDGSDLSEGPTKRQRMDPP